MSLPHLCGVVDLIYPRSWKVRTTLDTFCFIRIRLAVCSVHYLSPHSPVLDRAVRLLLLLYVVFNHCFSFVALYAVMHRRECRYLIVVKS